MRICMIATTLPPVVGGLETHVWELSRALADAGHAVHLIGSKNFQGRLFPEREERENLRVYRVRDSVLPVYYFRYRLFCIGAALLARSLHGKEPFDVVHAHQVYPSGVAGALLRCFTGIPLAITCHGTALFRNWGEARLRPLMKWALSRAALVIGVGGEIGEKLAACGVPPSKISVLPNCVDTRRFSPERRGEDVRRRHGLNPDETVIAYVGRLHPVKGPHYFLRMAMELLKERPSLRFLLVGSGELEDSLRREAGGDRAFIFAGEIGHDAVPEYMGAADVIVVPSLAEGGGLTCMEGMAAGKAVVANRVGGIADILEDGRTGVLVPLESSRSVHHDYGLGEGYIGALVTAVGRVASDAALRERLGANARREAEMRYSREACVKRLLPLYERMQGGV